MIAYDKKNIDALQISKLAKSWFLQGLIDESTKNNICAANTSNFKSTKPLAKIGLFIFTLIACLAATLFVLALLGFEGRNGLGFSLIVLSVISVLLAENLIKNKHYYRSGIDNALIYYGSATFLFGIGYLFERQWGMNLLTMYCISGLLLTAFSIRYCDPICSAAAFYSLLGIFYQLLHNMSFTWLPFFCMLLAALVYFFSTRNLEKPQFRYHKNNLHTLRLMSLLSFYLAGNYFDIREAMQSLLNIRLKKGDDIPMALFFYLFTALTPLIYIYWGLRKKDRLILLTGLGTTILSALTFKNYFSFGHPEILFSAVGVLLIVIAYAAIRYLAKPKHGLSNLPNKNNSNLEALALVQTFANKSGAPSKQDQVQLGGGQFGGGGAEGGY